MTNAQIIEYWNAIAERDAPLSAKLIAFARWAEREGERSAMEGRPAPWKKWEERRQVNFERKDNGI